MSAFATGVAGLRGWRRAALALFCGAMLTLAQPPVSWPILLFVAFPLLLWLLNGTHPRPMRPAAWRLGWVAGFGYFLTGLYWIGEAFLVDIVRHGWMAPFAIGLMAGGLAIFWAAGFAVARRAANGWPRALALAAALTLAEYARSHVFTGFPWALQAYAWVETPVAQTASLYGPHTLGLLTLIAALAVGVGRFGFVAALVMVGAGWGWGVAQMPEEATYRADGYTVRVVQPNARQRDKWLPEMQPVFFRRLLDYSASDPAAAPDLIIWPETAVPFLVDESAEARRAISSVAAPARVALGTRRIDRSGAPNWRNSVAVIDPEGTVEAIYDKRHLVPFGEYVPFYEVLSRFGLGPLVGESGGFAPGGGTAQIDIAGVPAFVAQICYETIFPHEMPGLADRPEWILQVTNDAWFGATGGPYQHLAQARMRAIETGLPLIRSANTGVSAIIGPNGRVLQSLPLLTEGAFESVLPAPLKPTAYVRSGDAP
jgi:apolipoprotein N-acyltransferase